MSNEYNLGVINAKIASLLTESDFSAFSALSAEDKLTFFINHNLVKTNLITNFESMCDMVLSDLKVEISGYLDKNDLYLNYFFARDYVKETNSSPVAHFNTTYEKAKKSNDRWFLTYLDLNHTIYNVMSLLRGAFLMKSAEEIRSYYLEQNILPLDTFITLIKSERSAVLSFIKTSFNLELPVNATNRQIEAELEKFLFAKLREFAYETDFTPTLIYYFKRKEHEVLKLREIYYLKEVSV